MIVSEVAAGESMLVPRGTAHSYWNPAAEPAHYLLVMTPRIHRLIEADVAWTVHPNESWTTSTAAIAAMHTR